MRIAHGINFKSNPIFITAADPALPNLNFSASGYRLFVGNQACHYFDNPVILQGLLTHPLPFRDLEMAIAMGKRVGSMKG